MYLWAAIAVLIAGLSASTLFFKHEAGVARHDADVATEQLKQSEKLADARLKQLNDMGTVLNQRDQTNRRIRETAGNLNTKLEKLIHASKSESKPGCYSNSLAAPVPAAATDLLQQSYAAAIGGSNPSAK